MVLKRGDTGPAVRLVQERLRGLGYLITEEPGFGAATEAAVRQFQADQGLGVDGLVGPRTLARLLPPQQPTREYLEGVLYAGRRVYDALDDVVAAVAAGEGGAFDALQLNGDGAGLSFGLLQWAQGPGSLHPLLLACRRAQEDRFVQIYGDGDPQVAQELLTQTQGPGKRIALWRGVWPGRFWAAGREPQFQKVQRSLARQQLLGLLEDGYRRYPAAWKQEGRIALRALVMLADVGNQAGLGGLRRALQYAAATGSAEEAGFIRTLGRYVENIIARKYGDPNYGNTVGRHLAICRQYPLARVDFAALKAALTQDLPQAADSSGTSVS